MCASVQAVPLRIRRWRFYLQPGLRGTGGATSPTKLQCTQPKVDRPKSLLWWAKPLKTKLRCEIKQRVAFLRQRESRAIFGWPPPGRYASWKRKKKLCLRFVWSRDQNDETTKNFKANVRHFELSRKRIAARMRACQCMSHFVYDLRSWPLVRDQPARVRGQIASDHCSYDLITGRTQPARAEYPYPEVNLPEIGNGKRDCAWGCARRKNITWENLHIEQHKSGRRSFRSPDWFVFSICRLWHFCHWGSVLLAGFCKEEWQELSGYSFWVILATG